MNEKKRISGFDVMGFLIIVGCLSLFYTLIKDRYLIWEWKSQKEGMEWLARSLSQSPELRSLNEALERPKKWDEPWSDYEQRVAPIETEVKLVENGVLRFGFWSPETEVWSMNPTHLKPKMEVGRVVGGWVPKWALPKTFYQLDRRILGVLGLGSEVKKEVQWTYYGEIVQAPEFEFNRKLRRQELNNLKIKIRWQWLGDKEVLVTPNQWIEKTLNPDDNRWSQIWPMANLEKEFNVLQNVPIRIIEVQLVENSKDLK